MNVKKTMSDEEIEGYLAMEAALAKKEWIARLIDQANIPKHFASVKTAIQFSPSRHSLVLSGPVGVGKTHAAIALLLSWIKNTQRSGLFTTSRDMTVDLLSAPYASSAKYSKGPFLVIDDLGVMDTTPAAVQIIGKVINDRWSGEVHTIITTNLDLPKIAEIYGDRVASRISESLIVTLDGPDRRLVCPENPTKEA